MNQTKLTEADRLTVKLSAFVSFLQLTEGTAKSYRPTLSAKDAPTQRLADLYDERMAELGDDRRAWRGLGWSR